jgi:hypothetical protein
MRCVLKFTQPHLPPENLSGIWDSLEQEQLGQVFGVWAANFFKGDASNA